MIEPLPWDQLFSDYEAKATDLLSKRQSLDSIQLPRPAIERIQHPTKGDFVWLLQSLKHHQKKWFVAKLTSRAGSFPKTVFLVLLDAGIDEVNPSLNKYFIEPCVRVFGVRRVMEYLLSVVESGADFRKAGAVNALYWAQPRLTFPRKVPNFGLEHATPESRAAYESLADLIARKRVLLLETFVVNPNLDVRRSIIPTLKLDDPMAYPDSHLRLARQAIEIARGSPDEYIRHRVEVQLRNETMLLPLPHRSMHATEEKR